MIVTISDAFRAAADLIEPEGAWTTKAGARDLFQNVVNLRSPTAVCWCATGAIDFMQPDIDTYSKMIEILSEVVQQEWVSDWNDLDWNTQENVVKHMRLAADHENSGAQFVKSQIET